MNLTLFKLAVGAGAIFQSSALFAPEEPQSTDVRESNLRGSAEMAKVVNDLIRKNNKEEFEIWDLLEFGKECKIYPTSEEKRECQRSLRRFEKCIDKSSYRSCCQEAEKNDDKYQRRLRCGSSSGWAIRTLYPTVYRDAAEFDEERQLFEPEHSAHVINDVIKSDNNFKDMIDEEEESEFLESLDFGKECKGYPTADEKRECQRSLRRFEDCLETSSQRTCCQQAKNSDDEYQRRFRCGGDSPTLSPTKDDTDPESEKQLLDSRVLNAYVESDNPVEDSIDESDKFEFWELSDFGKECKKYETSDSKRECQRSLRRFEKCLENSSQRSCCREAQKEDDKYQRRLRCSRDSSESDPTTFPTVFLDDADVETEKKRYHNDEKEEERPVVRLPSIAEATGEKKRSLVDEVRDRIPNVFHDINLFKGNSKSDPEFSSETSIDGETDEGDELSDVALDGYSKECKYYKPKSEKQACKRSLRRFESCIYQKSYRRCCKKADFYQWMLRCYYGSDQSGRFSEIE